MGEFCKGFTDTEIFKTLNAIPRNLPDRAKLKEILSKRMNDKSETDWSNKVEVKFTMPEDFWVDTEGCRLPIADDVIVIDSSVLKDNNE